VPAIFIGVDVFIRVPTDGVEERFGERTPGHALANDVR